jgi:hypothetical protein
MMSSHNASENNKSFIDSRDGAHFAPKNSYNSSSNNRSNKKVICERMPVSNKRRLKPFVSVPFPATSSSKRPF